MNKFSNILYVADSGPNNSEAFNQAASLAIANQAKLTVVGILHDLDKLKTSASLSLELAEAVLKLRKEKLEKLVKSAAPKGLKVEIKIFSGKAFVDIISEVLEFNRDLLIKPIEQKERIGEILFGGTDMKLLRKCPCPVWLIKSTDQHDDKDILVGLDYDPDNIENEKLNSHILELATSLALSDSSQLHITHAWHLPYESFLRSARSNQTPDEVDLMVKQEEDARRTWLTELVENCIGAQGKETTQYLKPQLHLIKGDAKKVVPELTEKLGIELVVMGTVGRTGIPGYVMGNTAETILNQIDCSVLTVKPEAFVSPVKLKSV